MKTDDKTLISALRILARDIVSDDGVANACILEAADRLADITEQRDALLDVCRRFVASDTAWASSFQYMQMERLLAEMTHIETQEIDESANRK